MNRLEKPRASQRTRNTLTNVVLDPFSNMKTNDTVVLNSKQSFLNTSQPNTFDDFDFGSDIVDENQQSFDNSNNPFTKENSVEFSPFEHVKTSYKTDNNPFEFHDTKYESNFASTKHTNDLMMTNNDKESFEDILGIFDTSSSLSYDLKNLNLPQQNTANELEQKKISILTSAFESNKKDNGHNDKEYSESHDDDDDDDDDDDEDRDDDDDKNLKQNFQQSIAFPHINQLPTSNVNGSKQRDTSVSINHANKQLNGVCEQSQIKVNHELIDALKVLKKGTSLLKYGRMGNPHFRSFHLTQDNDAIKWYSKNKNKKYTQIRITDMNEILSGQKTRTFQRLGTPTLACSSFSIIYSNYKKSLDLVTKTQQEHTIWVQGLTALQIAAQSNQHTQLLEIMVQVKSVSSQHSSRNSRMPTLSAHEALKKLHRLQRTRYQFEEQLNTPKMLASDDYGIASNKLESLRAEMSNIATLIREKKLHNMKWKLWQIAVEIETVDNLVQSMSR